MKTLAIVDDNRSIHYIIESIFTDFRVVGASDGRELSSLLERELPDIILLDVMMPEEDGFTIASRLAGNERYRDIPVIFLSARDKGGDVVQGLEAGAYDYIRKPFDHDELQARVRLVIAQKENERRLRELSRTDPLTGLHNRRYFVERLEEELERTRRRSNDALSLCMIDIDFFKAINDTYGHAAGDFILKSFADAIRDGIRPYDIAGRFGGEEFILLFPHTALDAARAVAERILSRVRESSFGFADAEIRFTFSAGVASSAETSDDAFTAESLIALADRRLYAAKESGRNRIMTG